MTMERDVFMHNYGQLASMLREYIGTLSAVNQMSLAFLQNNDAVLKGIVDSSYHAYMSMQSLVESIAAAGNENAEAAIIASKEFTDDLEESWRSVKDRLSGKLPNLNHPLLAFDFVVGKEPDG